MTPSPEHRPSSELLRHLPLKPGWLIGLGIALIVLGLIALAYVVGATVASVVYIGVLMALGGVLQLAHAWSAKGWKGFLLWSLSGVLYLLAGVVAISNPLVGATILTLIFGAFLIASGFLRLWVWFQNRAQAGGGWLAFSGLITLAAGLIIAAGWPGNSIWVLGLILGIDLLTQGWAILLLGMAVKRSDS
ncbi:HdeD family acid-resistance protein [Alcaligenes sp. SDU_A2]|uniref:HdeD family acid-resistance protein n=1 Tax=Alcaligenes sp. SDU_A2 TaxID=3136634 RepID=UPI00311F6AE6